jgi:acyl-CoA thioester hydrolase
LDPIDFSRPLALHEETVRPEWIDYNGHMNLAYYLLAFDHASDRLFDFLDIGHGYVKGTNSSFFALETHVVYAEEVHQGDPIRFTSQILGADAKRIHLVHQMFHGGRGYLSATNELMFLHVDLGTRRSAPMPEPQVGNVLRLAAAHAALPRPPETGRVMGLKRPG